MTFLFLMGLIKTIEGAAIFLQDWENYPPALSRGQNYSCLWSGGRGSTAGQTVDHRAISSGNTGTAREIFSREFQFLRHEKRPWFQLSNSFNWSPGGGDLSGWKYNAKNRISRSSSKRGRKTNFWASRAPVFGSSIAGVASCVNPAVMTLIVQLDESGWRMIRTGIW